MFISLFLYSIFLFRTLTATYTSKMLPVTSFNKMITFIFTVKLTT